MAHLSPVYQELRQARMRVPFVPFTIVMQDGRRFEVTDRFQAGFNEFTILITEPAIIHRLRMKDLLAVEIHEPAT